MSNIAYVFSGGIIDIMTLVLVLWGIMNIPFIDNRKIIGITGVMMALLLLFICIFFRDNLDILMILETCVVVLMVCFLFQGNIFKLIAYSLLAYLLALFLCICLSGIGSVMNISREDMLSLKLYNIAAILLIGIIAFIRQRKRNRLQFHLSKRIYALLFAGAGTGIMMIGGLLVDANSRTGERARRIVLVVTIIIMMTYCAACIMMVFITESRDSYKALSKISQSVIDAQQQYYTVVNEKQQEIRSIRHEMKNHLACIRGLYKADKLPEMEEYINQLIETSSSTEDLLDTGNDIVNAILNEVQSRYRKERIAIRLEGGFPPQLYIAPMDLCIVIANIITNAVEAIQRIESKNDDYRYVDLKISSFKDELYIDVRNPIDHKIHIMNGRPVTDKKDRNSHGFGINNVIQRVEKYKGTFHYHIKNNYFFVEINMKNQLQ